MIMPDAAPSIFHRVRAKTADFWTVLEPHKGTSKIKSVTSQNGRVLVTLQGGVTIAASLDEWIKK